MGARSYTLLITKQLIINQLDRDKGKGASGAGEAPVRWRRTRAIRSRRRPSPYTFLTTTLHFQPGPKHSPRHFRPDRESLPRLPISRHTIAPSPHFAKLPHIGTRLEALPSLPRCATGRNRPLAQVVRRSGAGRIFGVGPAPPQGTEPRFAAQVPSLFPHLRQQ